MNMLTTDDGRAIPIVISDNFLVDFGPTPEVGITTWLMQYRAVLNEVGQREFGGIPVPMEVLARGRSGRTVIRVLAPDPTLAVWSAEKLLDDGPKVVAL